MLGLDIDKVDLGNALVIQQQSIGVAKQQKSFGNGIDGILGVGPTGLTRGKQPSTRAPREPRLTLMLPRPQAQSTAVPKRRSQP